jgi:hypothetical protein
MSLKVRPRRNIEDKEEIMEENTKTTMVVTIGK